MVSEYFFPNTLEDYSRNADFTNIERRIATESELLFKKTRSGYESLRTNDYSVYTGTAGIALLYLRKSNNEPKLLKEALRYLNLDKVKCREAAFLCGDSGTLAIGAVVYHRLGMKQESNELINKLIGLKSKVLDPKSDVPNELLYGRAGYLFTLLFLNKNIETKPIQNEIIRKVIEVILTCGTNESKLKKSHAPLMYQFSGRYYLGAAHGLSGILYILLQASEYLTKPELNNLIKPTINYLPNTQLPSGNYKIMLDHNADVKVQWCHGAPGFTALFCKAFAMFKDETYLKRALECGEIVWSRGLLRKGYSICHGVSGNAYTFLELYQTTNDPKHLYRAMKFAEWCLNYTTELEGHSPDRPFSLFEGVTGRLYFLEEMKNPKLAKFPGYTL